MGQERKSPWSLGSPLPPPSPRSSCGGHSPAAGHDSGLPPSGNAGTRCCFPKRYRMCSPARGTHNRLLNQGHQTASGCSLLPLFQRGPAGLVLGEGAGSEDLGHTQGHVSLLPVPSPWPAPEGSGTWSARKSLSMSRRVPPLVAMGTVIFIITPWMGNKPRFWICGEREAVRAPAAVGEGRWRTRSTGAKQPQGCDPPARLRKQAPSAPWHFCCGSCGALPSYPGAAGVLKGLGSCRLRTSGGHTGEQGPLPFSTPLGSGRFIAWHWSSHPGGGDSDSN